MNPKDPKGNGFSAASRLSEQTGHPGNDIKPCIATMLETTFERGSHPDRNSVAVFQV